MYRKKYKEKKLSKNSGNSDWLFFIIVKKIKLKQHLINLILTKTAICLLSLLKTWVYWLLSSQKSTSGVNSLFFKLLLISASRFNLRNNTKSSLSVSIESISHFHYLLFWRQQEFFSVYLGNAREVNPTNTHTESWS